MTRLALITGITGQDGSYLAEFLLGKGYKVYGIVRRNSYLFNLGRIQHIENQIELRYGDMTDCAALTGYLHEIMRNNTDFERFEIYNLAAQSHVQVSFEIPEYTTDVDANGTLRLLNGIMTLPEACRPRIRFYQASTSELYGKVLETPQSETTPFNPCSPYAVAKLYAFHMTKVFRESYNLFAINGILFNHESARRVQNFLTMKVVNGVKAIARGNSTMIQLGNLNAKRDWGWAPDYVAGMWLMMQNNAPKDYVLATGQTYTVREFVEEAFAQIPLTITWSGFGQAEVGRDEYGQVRVQVDPQYFRPNEVELLLGDPSMIERELGWQRSCQTLTELVRHMFEDEI